MTFHMHSGAIGYACRKLARKTKRLVQTLIPPFLTPNTGQLSSASYSADGILVHRANRMLFELPVRQPTSHANGSVATDGSYTYQAMRKWLDVSLTAMSESSSLAALSSTRSLKTRSLKTISSAAFKGPDDIYPGEAKK